MKRILFAFSFLIAASASAQLNDTIPVTWVDSSSSWQDTSLRITNLTPTFNLHVDSSLSYQLLINKNPSRFYWYLKNTPVGLRIGKDNGFLTFKSDRSYFLSGRLKYDKPYIVNVGVQSLFDPKEKADTSFTIVFYNTEIIPSRIKPTVAGVLTIDEGEAVAFRVLCEIGSFPIEEIIFSSSRTIQNFNLVKNCGDEFTWTPGFDFVKETDSAKLKILNLYFTGSTRFKTRDTAIVRLIVRDALNYPLSVEEHKQLRKNIDNYILQLKYSFLQIDRRIKKTRSTRTAFDLTTGTASLSGTILNSTSGTSTQKAGKILPGVGLSLVPIKEAVAPQKSVEQNQASMIRTSIKRLEYMLTENELVGEKDPDILQKTKRLRDEFRQTQVQLIDVPLELEGSIDPEALNQYFNSKKVSKKYRLK